MPSGHVMWMSRDPEHQPLQSSAVVPGLTLDTWSFAVISTDNRLLQHAADAVVSDSDQ